MGNQLINSKKHLVIAKKDQSKQYLMADGEYVNVIVNAEQSDGAYVISDGTMEPGSFVPNHYHKWEDQTFHVIEGELEAKIGDQVVIISAGDSIHCPRGTAHFIKNIGPSTARLLSYMFPGDYAEAFFAETSRQNTRGEMDFDLIEKKFGVVYL